MQMIMNEYQSDPLTIAESIKYRPRTWTDEITKIMQRRGLSICNRVQSMIIQNKTIMDWVLEYMK